MKRVILIRFGEIFLKGKNRGYFERALVYNIKKALEKFNLEVLKVPGRYVVSGYNEEDEFEILERVGKIAGIFSYSPAVCFETDFDVIAKTAV